MKKKSNAILNILIAVLVGIMLFSGYKLLGIWQDAKESDRQFEKLEQIIREDDRETAYNSAYDKYKSIYNANNHFTGWIFIPDTPLSYPVVQTPDDPEYYLRRDFEGRYSSYGVPFMDYKCVVDESDNIIVYGHNMLNGTMFSAVEKYASKSYWQQHPYIGFDTLNGFGTYEVVLCARIDLQTTDFYYVNTVDFATQAEFDDYMAKATAHSLYSTGVTASYGDKLLLLSTCQSNYDDGRYVVIAKKISQEDLSAKDLSLQETE